MKSPCGFTKKQEGQLRKLKSDDGEQINTPFIGFSYELSKTRCPNCWKYLEPYDGLYDLTKKAFHLYDLHPKNLWYMFLAVFEGRNPMCYDCTENFNNFVGQMKILKRSHKKKFGKDLKIENKN